VDGVLTVRAGPRNAVLYRMVPTVGVITEPVI